MARAMSRKRKRSYGRSYKGTARSSKRFKVIAGTKNIFGRFNVKQRKYTNDLKTAQKWFRLWSKKYGTVSLYRLNRSTRSYQRMRKKG